MKHLFLPIVLPLFLLSSNTTVIRRKRFLEYRRIRQTPYIDNINEIKPLETYIKNNRFSKNTGVDDNKTPSILSLSKNNVLVWRNKKEGKYIGSSDMEKKYQIKKEKCLEFKHNKTETVDDFLSSNEEEMERIYDFNDDKTETVDDYLSSNEEEIERIYDFNDDKTEIVDDYLSSNEEEKERIYNFNDDKKHEYFLSKISEILEKKPNLKLARSICNSKAFLTDTTFENNNLNLIFFWLQKLLKELNKINKKNLLMNFEEIILGIYAEEIVKDFLIYLKQHISLFVEMNIYNIEDFKSDISKMNLIVSKFLIRIFSINSRKKIFHLFPQFESVLNLMFKSKNSYNFLNFNSIFPTFLLIFIVEDSYKELQGGQKTNIEILYTNRYFERLLIFNYAIQELVCSLDNISDQVKQENLEMIPEFMDNINFFDENKSMIILHPRSNVHILFTYYNFLYSIVFLYIENASSENKDFETSLFNIINYLNFIFYMYRNDCTLDYPTIFNMIEEMSRKFLKLNPFKNICSITTELKILNRVFEEDQKMSFFNRITRYNKSIRKNTSYLKRKLKN
ncbi:hypothetical protein CWI39_1250p0010 [Hamiltosporidium magnivora]|uniref:Uncharacterized protein n=1 Tax=Hamiltosporidium magnivora TaxID=148818 RepID=A0A4Q9L5Y6_9MICR|nr:hypothetical protein CWI39_1250p0010 [Hamiltosporidium magnivora]